MAGQKIQQPEQRTGENRQSALALLKSLGQAAKDVSLYRSSHPIAVAALGKSFKILEALLSGAPESGWILTLSEDRWLSNGIPIVPAFQAPEILKNLYINHGISSLTFLRGVRLYEFSALCELASIVPKNPEEGYLAEYLLQRGVRNIQQDNASYAGQRPSLPTGAAPSSPRSFSSLLRNLIETAVKDPEERAHLYADALQMVKQGLDRQVAESTEALRSEKEALHREQGRAERVLAAAADGKVIVDKEGKIVMMNPTAEEISGKSLAEIAGKPITETINPEEQMLALSTDLEFRREKPISDKVRLIAQDEVERALKRSVAVIHDEAGRVVGTYSILPDAAKFKETRKIQEEFVSHVTHELKAPLASISCALELIMERLGSRLTPEESNFLAIGMRNSKRLEEMIVEILDFSQLESGRMNVKLAPCEVEPIVREALLGLEPWAKTKGTHLAALPADPKLPPVLADRRRLLQILTNLISNAIKSTPSGGKITVGAQRGTGENFWNAVLSVSDTGCGIAPENRERIFEKFIQLEGREGPREGIGLGLSIVKELVRSHRGSVWVESPPEGGSAFHFTIPLSAEKTP